MNPLKSVAFKLSVLTSFFVLLVIGLMARRLIAQAEDGLVREMTVRADFFARSSREALFPKVDPFLLHFQVREMLKEKAVTYAAVLDADGRVLSHSKPSLIGGTMTIPRGPFDVAAPIYVGQKRVGTALLGFDSSSLEEALRQPKRQIAQIAGFSVALAILGTIGIVGWITRPLPKLAAAAREVGRGNFNVRVEHKAGDEIGLLARAFNDMAVANALLFRTIREEKQKLETLFQETREGIVWTNEAGRVILINHAARALLAAKDGAETIEALAASAGMEGAPALSQIIAGAGRSTEFELRRKDPKPLILAGVADRIGQTGEATGLLFVFRDATLEKRGETLARNFLSLVSHKLRTPLAVSLGFLEILEGDSDLKAFHKQALGKVRGESEKLRHLVEKLITYSTVQSPESIELQKADMKLSDAVSEAIRVLGKRLDKVEVTVEKGPDPAVNADPLLAREAIANLIENAVKFNKADQKAVRVTLSKEDGRARVVVKDNGPGIPSEEHPKLFRKFHQIDDDFTGQVPGFGLGLAFVKNVAEAHGGSVGMSSAPGKGSEFWFTLPS